MPTFSALPHVKKKKKEIPALGCDLGENTLFLFWVTFKTPV